jgi:hypothetical protein
MYCSQGISSGRQQFQKWAKNTAGNAANPGVWWPRRTCNCLPAVQFGQGLLARALAECQHRGLPSLLMTGWVASPGPVCCPHAAHPPALPPSPSDDCQRSERSLRLANGVKGHLWSYLERLFARRGGEGFEHPHAQFAGEEVCARHQTPVVIQFGGFSWATISCVPSKRPQSSLTGPARARTRLWGLALAVCKPARSRPQFGLVPAPTAAPAGRRSKQHARGSAAPPPVLLRRCEHGVCNRRRAPSSAPARCRCSRTQQPRSTRAQPRRRPARHCGC